MEKMTLYVVSEERLETLTEKNDDARDFKAVASGVVSFGLAFATHFVFAEKLSVYMLLATAIIVGGCFIVGGALFLIGCRYQKRAGGLLTRIKSNPYRARFDFHIDQSSMANDLRSDVSTP